MISKRDGSDGEKSDCNCIMLCDFFNSRMVAHSIFFSFQR